MTVTFLLVDDHPMIRQGLRSLLEGEPGFRVVGEAEDGVEALGLVEKFKPDILVVDMMMPGLNGLEVLRQVNKISPSTRTIVLSMQNAETYVIEALKNGASGYVLKETAPSELIHALYEVLKGGKYLSPKLAKLFQTKNKNYTNMQPDRSATLTFREIEILQMTAEGRTSQQIGEKLVISPRTVEVHRGHIMNKLGLQNQSELIRFAIKRGLIPLDD